MSERCSKKIHLMWSPAASNLEYPLVILAQCARTQGHTGLCKRDGFEAGPAGQLYFEVRWEHGPNKATSGE